MTRKMSVPSRVSTLALAVALAAGPSPAAAQSFQGTGVFTNPTAGSISTPDSSTTNISITASQAVIDWTPTPDGGASGTAINFQPSGTTATFSSASDFAVLNRVNVADNSRIVAMSGTINSLVNGNTGGSIYFYSPSGFVIGSSAIINVGSLVLSASPITVDGSGNFINGTTVEFGQAPNPTAKIVTNAGSQISALNEGSYVALVAPRVEHHGVINVNGAAVLVGAEAATINFRAGGLFDIQVDVGTTDENGVVADGTITGPISSNAADYHRAYLVAIPKNSALTMLIGAGANLGFDIAGAADVDGNAVVLSAGYDISFGGTNSAPSAASGADADFSISNANFTSAFYGRANGDALAGAVDGSLTFASDVSLRGRDTVRLDAGGGGIVSVGGNLTMSANASGSSEGAAATAGDVTLQAFAGGTLNVTGNTDLSAIGTGGFSATGGLASGDGTGGVILVQATTGGDMSLGGTLNADVTGRGGSTDNVDVDGGDGFGGTVNVFASGDGTLSVTGGSYLTADGEAGSPTECFSCGGIGGIGDAGTVNVQAHSGSGSSIDLGDVLYVWANGYGGDGQTGDGGSGLGGNVSFSASDGSNVTVTGEVSIQAEGYGGSAFGGVGDGGSGLGGNVQAFAANGGALGLTSNLLEYVGGNGGDAEGGSGGLGEGGLGQLFAVAGTATVGGYSIIDAGGIGGSGLIVGGEGQGGSAYFSSSGGGSLTFTGFASLSADGDGGSSFDADGLGGNGGIGHGGHVEAYANDATLSFGSDLYLDANGEGGGAGATGATTGAGFGGDIYLQAVAGGTVTLAQGLYAYAVGEGGTPNFGVYSGNGTGGTITVISRDGTSSLTVAGPAYLNADGEAGYSSECSSSCSAGGIGQGGDIYVASTGVLTGSTLEFESSLFAAADGYGGDSAIIDFDSNTTIDGGEGLGGTINLYANGGNSVSVAGDVTLEAIGYGGYDPVNLAGGDGTGGVVQITTDANAGNLISLGSSVLLDASGYGGDSGISANGDGGDGFGGNARVAGQGGTISIAGDLTAYGIGEGGDTFGGTGGNGTGNSAEIFATGGITGIGGSVLLDASGFGGNGLQGGNGLGGGIPDPDAPVPGAYIFARNATITIGGTAELSSTGVGGDGSNGVGGNGGNGTGGWAAIQARNADAGPSSISAEMAILNADGTGGDGGTGQSGNAGGDGGDGGTGTGGSAGVNAAAGNGMVTLNSVLAPELYNLTATAIGTGGRGGDGGSGIDQPGGNGGNGGAAIGGDIQFGTISGNFQALDQTDGVGNYGTAFIDGSAIGGDGGNGGSGSIQGDGGDGGDALGGGATLLVRGSTVNIDLAILVANANGGDGGTGSASGAGGDATIGSTAFANTGGIAVIVTQRFQGTTRGQLNAGTIDGQAIATGGLGSTPGVGLTLGRSEFLVSNSDATIGSLTFTVGADAMAVGAAQDIISVVNGDVTVNGSFSFVTGGQLSLFADNGTMSSDALTLTAADFIFDAVNGPPTNPGTYFANSATITTGNNFLTDANLNINGDFSLIAPGSIATGVFTTAGLLDLWGQSGSVHVERILADASVSLLAGAFVDTGDIDAGTGVTITAQGGSMDIGNVIAGGDVTLLADTFINGDNITTTGAISADTTSGNLDLADLSAGTDVLLDSGASMSLGNVTAQAGSVQASAVDVLTFGSITAGTFVTIDPTAIIGGDIVALAGDVTATGDSIDIGNVTASDNVFLTALAGDLSTLDISAGIDVTLDATGAITTGDISAFGTVNASGGSLNLGDVNASVLTFLSAIGDIATGDLVAFSSLTVDSAADFLFGSITAPLVDLNAPGSIIGGFIDSDGDITAVAGADIDVGDLTAGGFDGEVTLPGDVSLTAGGDITAGLVTAEGSVSASAGGGISTGDIDAFDFVQLLAGTNIATGDILAGSYIDIFSTGGGIATGDLTGTEIDLEAVGDISFANVDADSLDFDTNGTVTGGDIVAFNQVGGDADGAITLGDITVGPGLPLADDFSVGIASATSITVGDVSGTDRVGFATFGDLTTGDLSASDLVLTMVGGDIVTGSITTQSDGIVYMADASMFIDAGGGEDNFVASLVLALDPVPTGGSITINGPVSTGLFQAAAGTGLTAGAINATTIEASAGGTATLNGIWSAQDVTLASNDIDITGSGGISGSASGLVTLISTNATQALIGDGLTGTGYALSNAEFGRIEGGSVYILARGDASAAQDMLIGDLTVTGPTAGSTIENGEGILVFATGDTATQTPGGVIRVVGDVTATGFGSGNAMEFYADLFELDAATGSISITSSGTTLGGELGLYADQIHVAEGSILDQLAVDPQYDGYQQDLNSPAAVQRPEGVLNAGVIWIESDNLQNILIQNTGTVETPAGFLANQVFVNEDFEVAGPPGSIDVVVNGQLQTQAGTLIGIAVRDAQVSGADLSPFTANSTINNCLLSGACGVIEPPEPPFPPGFTPTPGIQQEIVLINDNLLPPPEFENENFIDDNDESTEEGDTSPIEPPQPLFDTSGLGDKGDVDDPVSGSGNPALMETTPPSSNQEKQP